jgi:hypothetical protein
MVEEVVGRGELDTPSTSRVCCCSLPLAAVLEVDVAGQPQDVAAATAAPVATMALSAVAAKMGARVWRRE